MKIYKIAHSDVDEFVREYSEYIFEVLDVGDEAYEVSEEHLRSQYIQIKQDIIKNIQSNPHIYRNIRYDFNPLELKTFGVFWSEIDIGFKPSVSLYDSRFNSSKGPIVTLKAKMDDLGIIDFPATVASQITLPSEQEIRLKAGSNIRVVNINGHDVNIQGVA